MIYWQISRPLHYSIVVTGKDEYGNAIESKGSCYESIHDDGKFAKSIHFTIFIILTIVGNIMK